ncbi:MAG: hypothetical protein J6A89_07155 [Clostridia bacterium]|nr:hypothetical protein [Clostridia bacterium]
MNKSKKSKFIIILLIIAILLSAVFSYYAYSKYTSTLTGNGAATVAKWSFKVNGEPVQFATINLEDTMDNVSNIIEKRVAPGTSGTMLLELDGRGSEVAIDYSIALNVAQKPTNLKMYTDSGYTELVEPDTNGIITITGTIPLEDIETVQNKYIYWKWPYETGTTEDEIQENDEIDTQQSSFGTIEMPITVTAAQKNPNATESLTLVSQITAANYGDKVNYSVTVENDNGTIVLDNWKVFYNDGSNVYMIYGDYMPSNAGDKTLFVTSHETYQLNCDDKNVLLNTANWSQLLSFELKNKGASATGAPTWEMWENSWEEKGYTKLKTFEVNQGVVSSGYEASYIDVSTDANGYADTLYFPRKEILGSGAPCYGYFLPSISTISVMGISSDYIPMKVSYDGKLSNVSPTPPHFALRGVICLPSNVLGEQVEDGVWNIE